jgi:hypothetical protein
VLGLGVGDGLRKVALTKVLELDRGVTAGAGQLNSVGGEPEEDLARERVDPRVQRGQLEGDVDQLVATREACQRDSDRCVAILDARS